MPNYPYVPSWRMPYDRDGTTGFWQKSDGTIQQWTNTQLQAANDENQNTNVGRPNGSDPLYYGVVFPEPRDLDAYFIAASGYSGAGTPPLVGISVSANTTNGFDGTWVQIAGSSATLNSSTIPQYRSSIVSSTQLAIRGFKIQLSNANYADLYSLHLYGEIAPNQNPDRLILWHPTLDQRVTPSYFDWADIPRSTSGAKTFRVKNNSASLTGHSIRVAMESLTDTTPSVVGQHSLSTDNSTFVAQVNIGDLAPGAISSPVYMKRVTPSNASLSLWAMRVFAEANTWS